MFLKFEKSYVKSGIFNSISVRIFNPRTVKKTYFSGVVNLQYFVRNSNLCTTLSGVLFSSYSLENSPFVVGNYSTNWCLTYLFKVRKCNIN